MSLTLKNWTPRRGSLTLKTAAEEHGKDGREKVDEGASSPMPADVGVAGTGGQQVSPAIMSLARQLLQIQAPVGPHLCDFVVGSPEGAVLRPTLRQVVIILVASVAYLEYGITLAWPNALATQLPSDNSTIFNHQVHFTHMEMDLVGSLLFSGLIVSALPAGWLMGWIGRRPSMVVACLPTSLGWLLVTFAHNELMIFAGRFICGLGVVIMISSCKIYVAEITNISFRGMATIFLETMKFVGLVMVAAASTKTEWYTIACINAVLVLVYGGAVLALPETPAFLIVQNKEEEALKALRLIRGPKADVDAELALLKLRNEQKDGKSGYAGLFNLDMLQKVTSLLVLILLRDFCGSDVIMVHTTRMLQDVGVTLDHGLSTFIVTSVGLCGVIFLSVVVDRIGRRWSLMASFAIMAAGYALLGFHSYFMPLPPPQLQPHLDIRLLSPLDNNSTASYMPEASGGGDDMESRLFPFFCLLGVAFANAAGVANVPILVAVEYFPTRLRPQGLAVCIFWIGIVSIVAIQLYSTMVTNIATSGLYWTYALFAAAGIVHTLFFIRETSRQDIG